MFTQCALHFTVFLYLLGYDRERSSWQRTSEKSAFSKKEKVVFSNFSLTFSVVLQSATVCVMTVTVALQSATVCVMTVTVALQSG